MANPATATPRQTKAIFHGGRVRKRGSFGVSAVIGMVVYMGMREKRREKATESISGAVCRGSEPAPRVREGAAETIAFVRDAETHVVVTSIHPVWPPTDT